MELKAKNVSNINDVFVSPIRYKILALCRGQKLKMVDLQRKLNITRGSLRYHLNILERFKLIEPMDRSDEEKGRPTYIKTNEERLKQLSKEDEQERKKREKHFLSTYGEPMKQILQFITIPKTIEEIEALVAGDEAFKHPLALTNLLIKMKQRGLIEEKYSPTKEGEDLFKDNSSIISR